MPTILLTKKFSFEMAHALDGYDGKCANLHGHSYHLEVTVEGTAAADNGISLDFHTIKDIVQRTVIDRFDHALVLHQGSPLANELTLNSPLIAPNLIALPFNPTTENLLLHFASLVVPVLPEGARLHSLRLSETDTSTAELIL